jgi:hypothetical protein
MLWAVLIGGVSGAIGAAVASLVIRDRTRHRTAYLALMFSIFAVLTAVGRTYVLPELRVWEARREAAKYTSENPVFSAIAARHPEFRTGFAELNADLARRNASESEARAAGLAFGQRTISTYFKEFTPTASDESLANFATVMSDLLDKLAARDDDACFAYLFKGRLPAGFKLAPEDEQRTADAMAAIVQSSSPRAPDDDARVKAAMQMLVERLEAEHGRDAVTAIAMAAHPYAPGVDHKALCDATRALYRTTLGLPQEQQALVLRKLLSGG